MPTCRVCGETHETSELRRHLTEGFLIVHCPDCHAPMGSYRVGSPAVDTKRTAS